MASGRQIPYFWKSTNTILQIFISIQPNTTKIWLRTEKTPIFATQQKAHGSTSNIFADTDMA